MPPPVLPSLTRCAVAIADEDPAARAGIRNWIEQSQASFWVCADFETVAQLEAQIGDYRPVILIIDPEMDGGAGLELIRKLRAEAGAPRCIARIGHRSRHAGIEALKAGAWAIVVRAESPADFLRVLVQSAHGEPAISHRAISNLVHALHSDSPVERRDVVGSLPERQQQIFRLIAQRVPVPEIAERFGIDTKTVYSHLLRMRAKLGVPTNEQLYTLAGHTAAAAA